MKFYELSERVQCIYKKVYPDIETLDTAIAHYKEENEIKVVYCGKRLVEQVFDKIKSDNVLLLEEEDKRIYYKELDLSEELVEKIKTFKIVFSLHKVHNHM